MRKLSVIVMLYGLSLCSVHAEITTDGTVGPSRQLQGPDFQIGAELGQQHGGNLFHSFDQFNVRTQESATFSGPDSVNNVIGRVTGGSSSEIDGTLRSTIPNADLYLINPAGMMFGENAKLDVQGSFHAGTADTVKFADGTQFNATHPEQSSFTAANPAAFGFLGNAPARLTVTGSTLQVPDGKTLSISGGGITVEQAKLNAPAGQLDVVSVGGAGDIIRDGLQVNAPGGELSMRDSTVDTSGEGGGKVVIRGGRFEVRDSEITADTLGAQNGGGLAIEVDEMKAVHSRLSSSTHGSGKGGDVRVQVSGAVELVDGQSDGSNIGVFSRAGEFENRNAPTGNGGNLSLQAAELRVLDGAGISATTYGPGQGGNLDIQVVGTIQLAGENQGGHFKFYCGECQWNGR